VIFGGLKFKGVGFLGCNMDFQPKKLIPKILHCLMLFFIFLKKGWTTLIAPLKK
jgi:hypothetical protein